MLIGTFPSCPGAGIGLETIILIWLPFRPTVTCCFHATIRCKSIYRLTRQASLLATDFNASPMCVSRRTMNGNYLIINFMYPVVGMHFGVPVRHCVRSVAGCAAGVCVGDDSGRQTTIELENRQ